MKNLKKGRKLHRKVGPRKALMKTLASSLVIHEKIKTTEAKAKELSPYIEKKITKAKKGDVASRRILNKFFSDNVTKKLVDEIAPKYKERNGGYTRVIKLGIRKSDGAKMAIIELV
jgi:large subunit ribosomal protein L17